MPELSAFIDGELSPSDRAALERHLASCPNCTTRVADLRAESGLIRVGLEMAADEQDWSGFSQRVLAQLTPPRLSLWERAKLSLSETFLYQRPLILAGMATAALFLLVTSTFLLRGQVPNGYAPETMAVQTVKIAPEAKVEPVVLDSDQGNTIIWLLDKPLDEQSPDARPNVEGGDLEKPAEEGGNL